MSSGRTFLGGRLFSPTAAGDPDADLEGLLAPGHLHFLPPLERDEEDHDAECSSARSRYQITLYRHADGLASEVFRAIHSRREAQSVLSRAIGSSGGSEVTLCIKRVTLEDQPRPHDVVRELQILLSDAADHENIVSLLAAVGDDSDPYCYTVDLLFPFYPFDLEDLLNCPSFTPKPTLSPDLHANTPLPPAPPGIFSPALPAFKPLACVHAFATAHAGGLYLPTVLSLSKQLLRAVEHLHHNGVSHRDIKPSNILISASGEALLCDFGTAWVTLTALPTTDGHLLRPLPDPLIHYSLHRAEGTRPVPEVGTGPYRAPELLFSPSNGYDTMKVDIWAAAVTIASFFRGWVEVQRKDGDSKEGRGMEEEDQRPDWEKALWAEVNGMNSEASPATSNWASSIGASTMTQPEPSSDVPLLASFHLPPFPVGGNDHGQDTDGLENRYSRPTHRREPLFVGTQGDIGLASSIFDLTGFPDVRRPRRTVDHIGVSRSHDDEQAQEQDEDVWPEAAFFSPTLSRMPFRPRAKGDLLENLPLAVHLLTSIPDPDPNDNEHKISSRTALLSDQARLAHEREVAAAALGNLSTLLGFMEAAFTLSAARRPPASAVLRALEGYEAD